MSTDNKEFECKIPDHLKNTIVVTGPSTTASYNDAYKECMKNKGCIGICWQSVEESSKLLSKYKSVT